jgi:hypothetical protein
MQIKIAQKVKILLAVGISAVAGGFLWQCPAPARPELVVRFNGFGEGQRSASFTLTNCSRLAVNYWVVIEWKAQGSWWGLPPGTVFDRKDRKQIAGNRSTEFHVAPPTNTVSWRITLFYARPRNSKPLSVARDLLQYWALDSLSDGLPSDTILGTVNGPEIHN